MELHNNVAIVTVGYNRKDSLLRLLDSLNEAEYNSQKVDLIISLDRSDCIERMLEMAYQVQWTHGQKKVRTFEKRQGLRNHILQCGDLTNEYDAVIVLEDDLVVSKWFYHYTICAINQYWDDERIGGISLYTHLTVPGIYRPFTPDQNGYDTFFVQFAQSWGQCWTRPMWCAFRNWYDKQEGTLKSDDIIPSYVAAWDDKSWLKYYIKYVAETNKYYVYPYQSLTTNASEAGEHNVTVNTNFQVPLLKGKRDYIFPTFEQGVKYDAFFERVWDDQEVLPEYKGRKIIDLYATKTNYQGADYLITTRELSYQVVKKIGLQFRPHEDNLIQMPVGKGIYVYDLKHKGELQKNNSKLTVMYDLKAYNWKKTMGYSLDNLRDAIVRRLQFNRH